MSSTTSSASRRTIDWGRNFGPDPCFRVIPAVLRDGRPLSHHQWDLAEGQRRIERMNLLQPPQSYEVSVKYSSSQTPREKGSRGDETVERKVQVVYHSSSGRTPREFEEATQTSPHDRRYLREVEAAERHWKATEAKQREELERRRLRGKREQVNASAGAPHHRGDCHCNCHHRTPREAHRRTTQSSHQQQRPRRPDTASLEVQLDDFTPRNGFAAEVFQRLNIEGGQSPSQPQSTARTQPTAQAGAKLPLATELRAKRWERRQANAKVNSARGEPPRAVHARRPAGAYQAVRQKVVVQRPRSAAYTRRREHQYPDIREYTHMRNTATPFSMTAGTGEARIMRGNAWAMMPARATISTRHGGDNRIQGPGVHGGEWQWEGEHSRFR